MTTAVVAQAVMAISLSVLAVGFVVVAFLLLRGLDQSILRATKSARWSADLPKLSDIILSIANASVYRHNSNAKEDFPQFAAAACQEIAAVFRTVTGHECRVALKETYLPEGMTTADTTELLVRSVVVVGSRNAAEEGLDRVTENTDFSAIMLKGASHYFSNDLVGAITTGYKNSHWSEEKLDEWSRSSDYPYRSTIVWPVRAQIDPSSPKQRWSTVGFLCVDCADSGVFDRKLDVVVGELIAQALYGAWPQTRR